MVQWPGLCVGVWEVAGQHALRVSGDMCVCVWAFAPGSAGVRLLDLRALSSQDGLLMHARLFPLCSFRYIQSTCATSGEGLYEGLDWLSQNISSKQ